MKELRTAKILFVCHGNICRSTMAEFVLKDMARKAGKTNIYIESAATSREEIGNDIYPPVKKLLKEKGIPFEHHSARQMRADEYDRFNYIIGMDNANIRNITRICGGDPECKIRRLLDFAGIDAEVADPWYTRDFEACYRDVVAGCEALIEVL